MKVTFWLWENICVKTFPPKDLNVCKNGFLSFLIRSSKILGLGQSKRCGRKISNVKLGGSQLKLLVSIFSQIIGSLKTLTHSILTSRSSPHFHLCLYLLLYCTATTVLHLCLYLLLYRTGHNGPPPELCIQNLKYFVASSFPSSGSLVILPHHTYTLGQFGVCVQPSQLGLEPDSLITEHGSQ